MPIKRSAYKELRKAKRRHARNITVKSELKTLAHKIQKVFADKDAAHAGKLIALFGAKLQQAVTKDIIHKNTASRTISRLMKKAHHLGKA